MALSQTREENYPALPHLKGLSYRLCICYHSLTQTSSGYAIFDEKINCYNYKQRETPLTKMVTAEMRTRSLKSEIVKVVLISMLFRPEVKEDSIEPLNHFILDANLSYR